MRIALIHHWEASNDVGDRVWDTLGRIWPYADRFTSDLWSSARDSNWAGLSPRRLRLLEEGLPRGTQLATRQPRNPLTGRAWLRGYDIIVSTNVAGANLVTGEADGLHVSFVGTLQTDWMSATGNCGADSDRCGTNDGAAFNGVLRVADFERPESDEIVQLSESREITHLIPISHAVASECHRLSGERPSAVVYPPIDTKFFRPGNESHQNYYLMVCHPGACVDLGPVIQAFEASGRELIILGAEAHRDEYPDLCPRIQWQALPQDRELRDMLRRCRALISTAVNRIDPALVEAQACGTPVIAYHTATTDEVVYDAERTGLGTGLFFHSLTSQNLLSAIVELEKRPQNVSAVLSLAQAEKFSLDHFEAGLLLHLQRWCQDRSAARLPGIKADSNAVAPNAKWSVGRRAA